MTDNTFETEQENIYLRTILLNIYNNLIPSKNDSFPFIKEKFNHPFKIIK